MSEGYWFCVWASAYFVFGFSLAYGIAAYGPKEWADHVLDADFPLGVFLALFWPMVGLGVAAYFVIVTFHRDVMRRRKIRDSVKDPEPAAPQGETP